MSNSATDPAKLTTSSQPTPRLSRKGWAFLAVVIVATVAAAFQAAVFRFDSSQPAEHGIIAMIWGAIAIFIPTIWFSLFAPFSAKTRAFTPAVVYFTVCIVLQMGEWPESAVANLLTYVFGVFGVTALGRWFLLSATRKVKYTVIAFNILAVALFFVFFKFEDPTGNMVPRIRYRFGMAHDRLLEKPKQTVAAESIDVQTTAATDFPRFLGVDGDSVVKQHAVLNDDWKKHAPKLVWRQPIGAGWSAFAIVNGYAFTLEQRDSQELVTCYELKTGKLLWSHVIEARHEDPLGGIGPRSTPTVVDGKVYAFGATGILRCLNGATGELLWQHDLRKERHLTAEEDLANVTWGRAASPLVVDDLVVVPAGGRALSQLSADEQKQLGLNDSPQVDGIQLGDFVSLIAYDRLTGEKVWQAGNSQIGYASPQVETLDGVRQIIIVNQDNVAGHDIKTGQQLWQFPWAGTSNAGANNSQAHIINGNRIFVTKGYAQGCALFEVNRVNDTWQVEPNPIWANRTVLKTKFCNVVEYDGYVYGLSDGVLECVDLRDGSRKWKRGKYGHGQVLLVNDLILVLGEAGELVLVQATPKALTELAQFQALEGKTWNNLALSGNLLLIRNAEEAACYELAEMPSNAVVE